MQYRYQDPGQDPPVDDGPADNYGGFRQPDPARVIALARLRLANPARQHSGRSAWAVALTEARQVLVARGGVL